MNLLRRSKILLLLVVVCSVNVNAAMPDYYSEPGYSGNRQYETQQAVEHIDPFTGSLQLEHIDVVAPGNAGMDIVARRIYRSPAGQAGVLGHDYLGGPTILGLGWDMHFGRIYHSYPGSGQPAFSGPGRSCGMNKVSSQSNPVLELSDGTRKQLSDSSSVSNGYGFITKDRWIGICELGYLVVVSPEGMRYTFAHRQKYATQDAWHVTKIEDRFGNYLSITYRSGTPQTLIDEVSSSDGRSLKFYYDNSAQLDAKLREIKLNGTRKMYYRYASVSGTADYDYLVKAERPISGDWVYTYYTSASGNKGLHALKTMTNPYSTKTTYEYDVVRFSGSLFLGSTVVDKKIVSGGGIQQSGTWIYNYSPGTASNPEDTTTVKSNNFCTQYDHLGGQGTSQNQVWRVGTLLERRDYNSSSCTSLKKREVYSWTKSLVTNQNEYHRRTNAADTETYQPVLASKVVTLDGSSYTTTYSNYDLYGNPQRVVESGQNDGSRTTNYTYQHFDTADLWVLNQLKTSTVSSVSGSTSNTYYTSGVRKGSLNKVAQYGVEVAEYDYHTSGSNLGNVKTVKDARNKSTSYSSYYRGIPRTESKPEGISISRNVNSLGLITSETDGKGYTTSFNYDGGNRITSINTPRTDDNNVGVSWSSGGRIRTVTRGNFSAKQTSDGLGRVIKIEAEGIYVNKTYNPEGQLIFESYPSSSQGTSYQYDVLGRLTRTIFADNNDIQYTYLSQNRVRITDENSHQTTYTYRSYGDPNERYLVRIDQPESITTVIDRDKLGNITTVTQNGVTRNYNYDSRKFLDTQTNPETGITDVNFDDAGNLISQRVGSSSTTTFVHDDLNRLLTVNYPSGTSDVSYLYDDNNNVTDIVSGTIDWNYGYDRNNNIISESLFVGNKNYDFSYEYDARDNLRSIIYPNGIVIDYQPDDLGRATKVSSVTTNSGIGYHANSQVSHINLVNGVSTSYGQDSRLRTDSISASGVIALSYSYDLKGNVKTINDLLNSSNNKNLIYDDVDRLTNAAGPWGSGSIAYSQDGDITSKNVGGVNLAYSYSSSNNRLNSISGTTPYSFSYDNYGNVTNNGKDSFVYNDASQLINVPSKNIQYEYDGNGRRVVKRVNGVVSKYMMYNKAGQLMFESDPYDDAQSAYVYLGSMLLAKQDYCSDQDNDGDGLGSCFEIKVGLDPSLADTDGDGIADGNEDSDNDGIHNAYEFAYGLNPLVNDSGSDFDGDGLTNIQEYNLGTSANDSDSDNDTLSDGWEVTNGTLPLTYDQNSDLDGDGLTNRQEFDINTNANAVDSDGNGISDASEDFDLDGLQNVFEFSNGTGVFIPDSDYDGMPDGWEVSYGLSPLVANDQLDPDTDGLTNILEYQYSTNPNKPDTDNDGVSDGDEIAAGTDPNFNFAAILPALLLIILN